MKDVIPWVQSHVWGRRRGGRAAGGAVVLAVFCMLAVNLTAKGAQGNEAHWIWSPEHSKNEVPEASCYFRKVFTVEEPIRVQATIAADDEYVLYVNGHRVGEGRSSRELDEYNITEQMRAGRNTIAARVANQHGSTAALVARIFAREKNGGWVTCCTDETWRTNVRPFPFWKDPVYDDDLWKPAQSFGKLGDTVPWDRRETVSREEVHRSERFRIASDFQVERVIEAEETGSLIAMAFNEFGQLILSREGGPLLQAVDSDRDDVIDSLRVYCERVKSVQGILPLNGQVYVTADGPEGSGFYCLSDSDGDGVLETCRLLFEFEGEMGEQGAHGIALGPDGWIYVVIGNHSSPLKEYAPSSPHRGYYEGDLARPRYEDPGGHAVGRKAPGGVVIRTDLSGQTVELFAGGLRNAYDLAFHPNGELFIHDSDMESDLGTTWYRPTRVCHVIPGAELGWRGGWAKWPDYYVDSLPAVAATGRGAPTGSIFYTHHLFPPKYQNALFLADWAQGRILAVRLKPSGASYTANTEVFLEGQPLNVTDLDVGPDGGLYFVTGGRGTGGGIYRVTYRGDEGDRVTGPGSGITAAIRMPQLQSAWSRQEVARLRRQLDEDWGPMLVGVARDTTNPTHYRTRALDLMQLYGPRPTVDQLLKLAGDKNETVRQKVIELMGIYGGDELHERMIDMLEDSDRRVRRKAMEALVRGGKTGPADIILPLLASDDRFEAWAARRLLEHGPVEHWRAKVLSAGDERVLVQGGLAMLIAEPNHENAMAVIERMREFMTGFVSDGDFIDMLRVMQVALMQGEVSAEELTGLRDQLAAEFPAGDHLMNRELVRLLVYLQCSSIMERYFDYLESDMPAAEKMHLAMYLPFLKAGWTTKHKIKLFRFLAEAKESEAGGGYPPYLGHAARDMAKSLTAEEAIQLLSRGDEMPDAALGTLYSLPSRLNDDLREALQELDERIDQHSDFTSKQLMVGIVAVLAGDGDDQSMAYLRSVWDRNPERRAPVAMGLAQVPHGENWKYLVRSLPIVESETLEEVVCRLLSVDRVPDDPEHVRQLILAGLRLKQQRTEETVMLLENWTGETVGTDTDDWQRKLELWQDWFARAYPDLPPATPPGETAESQWNFDELHEFLRGREGRNGDAASGAVVFQEATCNRCHRFGKLGESVGPDLTDVTKRVTRKRILQSMLYPSHVISSHYASKNVILTDDRVLSGIVTPGPAGKKVLLDSNGEKTSISEEEIDEITPSNVSTMPAGLLKTLSQEEISDLFAYLSSESVVGLAKRPRNERDGQPATKE